MPAWLIWVIVIVVVLVVIAAVVVSLGSKRRTGQRRGRAEQLRQEASGQASDLAESQRRTEELRARADLARSEAERAEERAATAEKSHQMEQAGYEDRLREADRLDPDVDTRAGDYQPDVWNDERSEMPADPAPRATTGPRTDPAEAGVPAEPTDSSGEETPPRRRAD
ncbi:MAG TPA: hypothetical protein VGK78_13745 [Nocardioides sp.]|uniref:hypothetical protein n=1 Tax=Nocardioides sp. TaxID=35761 RepID=UPI002F3E6DE1